MDRIWAIAMAVVSDAARRKLVYVVVLFAAVMAAAIPMLPSYGQGVVEAVFREVSLALIYVVAMIIAVALGATRLPTEIERRTIYPILARGVRRHEYIVGTWIGLVMTLGAMLVALSIVTLLIAWGVYGTLMLQLLGGVLAIWFEAGVVAAFCLMVATVAGPVVVSTAAIAFLFVTHVRSVLFAPGSPAAVFYPSLDTFNVINPVAHGQGITLVYALTMLLVWAAFAGVLLVAGSALFTRRDL
jgi:ABC-type transport system involved in multi-copper enzyme maturation permease subunit